MAGKHRVMWFDRAGCPISKPRYQELCGDPTYIRVAWDDVGEWHVSTVWLGLDQGWGGKREIFESKIIYGPLHRTMVRCATEHEALEWHARLVAMAKKAAKEQVQA